MGRIVLTHGEHNGIGEKSECRWFEWNEITEKLVITHKSIISGILWILHQEGFWRKLSKTTGG